MRFAKVLKELNKKTMTKKIFKLFRWRIFEVETYSDQDDKPIESPRGKPEGIVLDFTPEDLKKENEKK